MFAKTDKVVELPYMHTKYNTGVTIKTPRVEVYQPQAVDIGLDSTEAMNWKGRQKKESSFNAKSS